MPGLRCGRWVIVSVGGIKSCRWVCAPVWLAWCGCLGCRLGLPAGLATRATARATAWGWAGATGWRGLGLGKGGLGTAGPRQAGRQAGGGVLESPRRA